MFKIGMIAAALFIAFRGTWMVHDQQALVVCRFGRLRRVRGAGPRFVCPGIEHGTVVSLEPQRISDGLHTSTGDGLCVHIDWVGVLTISDGRQAWLNRRTFPQRAIDLVNSAVAQYAASVNASELRLNVGVFDRHRATVPKLRLSELGARIDQLLITRVVLPREYQAATSRLAVQIELRDSAVLEAETARRVAAIETSADLDRIAGESSLTGLVDPQVLELERIRVRGIAARNGATSVIVE